MFILETVKGAFHEAGTLCSDFLKFSGLVTVTSSGGNAMYPTEVTCGCGGGGHAQ